MRLIWLFLALWPACLLAEAGTFTLEVNPRHRSFGKKTREPVADGVTIQQKETPSPFVIIGFAKKTKTTKDVLWLEFFVENKTSKAYKNLTIDINEVQPNKPFFDYTVDGQTEIEVEAPYQRRVHRIAPFSMIKVILGIPWTRRMVSLSVTLDYESEDEAVPLKRTTALEVNQKGDKLWTVNTDGNEVVVIDPQTEAVIDRIAVAEGPANLSISYDDRLVAVASAKGNRVTVIDQISHKILSELGEDDRFGRELQYLVFSPRSHKVYVSSYVEGLLTQLELDPASGSLLQEKTIDVGPRPTGMSMNADGRYLYLAHFLPRGPIKENESYLSIVDLEQFNKSDEALIEDHFNPGRDNLKCLADFYSSNPVTRIAIGKVTPDDLTFEGVASQLSGVFLDPSGSVAWVPGTRITGALVVLERGEGADPDLRRFGGLAPGQYVASIQFMFNAEEAGKLKVMYGHDREMSLPGFRRIAECFKHPLELEAIPSDVLNQDKKEQTNIFLAYAIPQAGMNDMGLVRQIAFTKGGRRALLLAQTSDEIAVYDTYTQNPVTRNHLILKGANPKGIALTPDGKKAFVVYENSPFVSVLDTSAYAQKELPEPYYVPYYYNFTRKSPLQLGSIPARPLIRIFEDMPDRPEILETSQIQLMKDPMDPTMRRGKILFESANPDKYPVSLSRLGACASCHPGGGADGSSWVTMEGARRTMSLRGGVGDRGYLHISATHADSYEFVEQVVPERLGGKLNDSDMAAIAQYVETGVPTLQNPRVDLESAARGEAVFNQLCVSCHAGSKSTSGIYGEKGLYNIGTGSKRHGVGVGRFFERLTELGDAPSAEIIRNVRGDRDLGPGDPVQKILDFRQRPPRKFGYFKAPTLEGAFDHAVFFHDASIGSLSEAIRKISELLHYNLDDATIKDLEEYIKTL